MSEIELIVGLKIPDTTAITSFHTLESMGFKELKKLKREDYYKFSVDGSFEKFSNEIGRVDILVNANKNTYKTKLAKDSFEKEPTDLQSIKVLVKNIGNGAKGILSVLQERLGFKKIKKMEMGILWTLFIDVNTEKEAKSIAKCIAQRLLYNEHYQECKLL